MPRKSLSALTVAGFDADLLICAAKRFDLHVGNQFPETHGVAANALLDEGIHLLPAFLSIADQVLGHIFPQNYSGGDIEKGIQIVSKRI